MTAAPAVQGVLVAERRVLVRWNVGRRYGTALGIKGLSLWKALVTGFARRT